MFLNSSNSIFLFFKSRASAPTPLYIMSEFISRGVKVYTTSCAELVIG
nr:MAG TPA: hypothetical protein [Bacteriophage sp.]